MPAREKGTVAKWLNHKGIGFITPEGVEGEGHDILVHYEQIKQDTEDGFRSLQQGAEVEYDLETDPKNSDKQVAVNVTAPGGGNCEPKKRGEKRPKKEPSSTESGDEKDGKKSKGSGKSKGKGKKGSKGKGKKGKGKKGSKGKDE